MMYWLSGSTYNNLEWLICFIIGIAMCVYIYCCYEWALDALHTHPPIGLKYKRIHHYKMRNWSILVWVFQVKRTNKYFQQILLNEYWIFFFFKYKLKLEFKAADGLQHGIKQGKMIVSKDNNKWHKGSSYTKRGRNDNPQFVWLYSSSSKLSSYIKMHLLIIIRLFSFFHYTEWDV